MQRRASREGVERVRLGNVSIGEGADEGAEGGEGGGRSGRITGLDARCGCLGGRGGGGAGSGVLGWRCGRGRREGGGRPFVGVWGPEDWMFEMLEVGWGEGRVWVLGWWVWEGMLDVDASEGELSLSGPRLEIRAELGGR